jgi:head-tail adaptor
VVNAGQLRHVVDVERVTAGAVGPRGGASRSWAVLHEGVPARVEETASEEADERGRLVVSKRYEVTVRYLDGLTEADRLVYEGRRLNIEAVTRDTHRRWSTLICGASDA